MKDAKWERPMLETVDDAMINEEKWPITGNEHIIDGYVEKVEKVHKKRKLQLQVLKGVATICILIFVVFGKTAYGEAYQTEAIQEGIAEEILRFHILANSDSEEDQALKLKVKGEVVSYLQDVLADCDTKEAAKEVIENHFTEIMDIAEKVIQQEGYHYDVRVEIANHYFPVKVYGDLVFPEGEYEALRILIGKAEGKNWWCVMFPSLCMVNETYSVVPEESKEVLQEALTEEEYEAIGGHKTQETNATKEEPTVESTAVPTEEQAIERMSEPTAEATEEPTPNVEYRFWVVDFFCSLF